MWCRGRVGGAVSGMQLWLRAGGVFAAAFAFLYHLQFQTPYIVGFDGYYHIRYASMLPGIAFDKQFPWAAHSVWATHFADKELLYHWFLVPFSRFADPAHGLKLATVLLGALTIGSFYAVLGLNRLRFPFFWTVLLCSSGPWFLYRLGLPRPHVLSMLLLLWCVHLILARRRRALAIVTLIYTLSYTAFHLAFGMALLISLQRYFTSRRLDWKTPAVVAGATILGMLIHPHFPNNLRLFWWQNFLVPWLAMAGADDLAMGRELDPLTTRELLLSHLALALPLLLALYLAVVRPTKTSGRTQCLFVVASMTVLMTLMMSRFIEYSIPLTLFFLASFYTDRLAGLDLRSLFRKRRKAASAVAILLLVLTGGLAVQSYRAAAPDLRPDPPMREDAALYLLEHTDPDELVFTCDWDDTPELFYFNQKNRYPVLLDPGFMYARDPEKWRSWFEVARGDRVGRTYDTLAPEYRYGVCTWDFEEFRSRIEKDPRMEIVQDNGSAYVFRIDRENPEISLDQFLELADDP
jgi:hypothetical protein